MKQVLLALLCPRLLSDRATPKKALTVERWVDGLTCHGAVCEEGQGQDGQAENNLRASTKRSVRLPTLQVIGGATAAWLE